MADDRECLPKFATLHAARFARLLFELAAKQIIASFLAG
jgi:hypothetical protein